jgi:hypothetical protein
LTAFDRAHVDPARDVARETRAALVEIRWRGERRIAGIDGRAGDVGQSRQGRTAVVLQGSEQRIDSGQVVAAIDRRAAGILEQREVGSDHACNLRAGTARRVVGEQGIAQRRRAIRTRTQAAAFDRSVVARHRHEIQRQRIDVLGGDAATPPVQVDALGARQHTAAGAIAIEGRIQDRSVEVVRIGRAQQHHPATADRLVAGDRRVDEAELVLVASGQELHAAAGAVDRAIAGDGRAFDRQVRVVQADHERAAAGSRRTIAADFRIDQRDGGVTQHLVAPHHAEEAAAGGAGAILADRHAAAGQGGTAEPAEQDAAAVAIGLPAARRCAAARRGPVLEFAERDIAPDQRIGERDGGAVDAEATALFGAVVLETRIGNRDRRRRFFVAAVNHQPAAIGVAGLVAVEIARLDLHFRHGQQCPSATAVVRAVVAERGALDRYARRDRGFRTVVLAQCDEQRAARAGDVVGELAVDHLQARRGRSGIVAEPHQHRTAAAVVAVVALEGDVLQAPGCIRIAALLEVLSGEQPVDRAAAIA